MCFSVLSLALSLVLLKALHANEEENANGEHDVFLRRPTSLTVIVVTPFFFFSPNNFFVLWMALRKVKLLLSESKVASFLQ